MTAASLGAVRPLPSATWRTAEWIVGTTLRILAVVAPLLLLLATGLAPAACTTEVSKPDDQEEAQGASALPGRHGRCRRPGHHKSTATQR